MKMPWTRKQAPDDNETGLINDGPDFCEIGACTRWKCRECEYVLYGTERKPPFQYCPMCGRRIVSGN